MAFNAANLTLMASGNGFNQYRYDTMDAHADVDTAGYINNLTHNQKMGKGDIVDVVVWATAVRTGTISTYGRHIVMGANASTGAVDLSNVTVGTVTNTD